MEIKTLSKIIGGQDGAIYKNYLFRFSSKGGCTVYDLFALSAEPASIAEFKLDGLEFVVPHSNSVVFGNEFFAPEDEFPLLYSNVYNNYSKESDRRVGVCCVYRIVRDGMQFSSSLVQLIEIGFADKRDYWLSAEGVDDIRPYGNFVVDTDKNMLYAFVMRDGESRTRYFAFDLPRLSDGILCPTCGVKKVTLTADSVKEYFDVPYHNFVQGAVCREGKIYSVEGFGEKIHPALRIIDTEEKRQILHFDLFNAGYTDEAELIDFYGDRCIYGDHKGNLFELVF